MHAAVTYRQPTVRQAAIEALKELTFQHPSVIHAALRDAFLTHLRHARVIRENVSAGSEEHEASSTNTNERLAPLIVGISAFNDSTSSQTRAKLMGRWLVLAHHQDVGKPVDHGRSLLIRISNLYSISTGIASTMDRGDPNS